MKLLTCGLAKGLLWNAVGASAAFILVGFLSSVGFAETAIERGSYLVNTIGACGNCHARDTAANRTSDLAGGLEINDPQVGFIVMPTSRLTRKQGLASGPSRRLSYPYVMASAQTGRSSARQCRSLSIVKCQTTTQRPSPIICSV
jgi:hypothetical protein